MDASLIFTESFSIFYQPKTKFSLNKLSYPDTTHKTVKRDWVTK